MRATRSWSRRRAPSSRRWERGSSPRLRPGSASSCTDVAGLRIYETAILPEWIDYNGHLRDAYYTLIVSLASDALMDRLHMDAAYRKRTSCTLYTVEMHIHYLDEVKATDTALVGVRIVGADHKRIHAAFEILRADHTGAAAVAEVMLCTGASGARRPRACPSRPKCRPRSRSSRPRPRGCLRPVPPRGAWSSRARRAAHERPGIATPAGAAQSRPGRRRLGGCRARGERRHRLHGRGVARTSDAPLEREAALFSVGRGAPRGTRCRLHRHPGARGAGHCGGARAARRRRLRVLRRRLFRDRPAGRRAPHARAARERPGAAGRASGSERVRNAARGGAARRAG